MKYKEGQFSERVPVSPFKTILMIAGKPLDNASFELQMAYLVTEGMAVVELEWKDAWGPRVLDVRSATTGEIEQFREAILRRDKNNEGESLAERTLTRLARTLDERRRTI